MPRHVGDVDPVISFQEKKRSKQLSMLLVKKIFVPVLLHYFGNHYGDLPIRMPAFKIENIVNNGSENVTILRIENNQRSFRYFGTRGVGASNPLSPTKILFTI